MNKPQKKNKSKKTSVQQLNLDIVGMHCASCEVLLERRLKKIPGVAKATVNYTTGKAKLTCERPVSRAALAAAINKDDYRLVNGKGAPDKHDKHLGRTDYFEIALLFLVFIALYFILKRFDILPSVDISDGASLGFFFVFVIGLIAASSTCLAVTGGLLLTLAAKYSEQHPEMSGAKRFKPTIYFTAGRVIGYTVFGAALGALGSLFSFSPLVSGVITLAAALVMILLGLQMLQILPILNRFSVRMPKYIAHRIHDKSTDSYRPWAPFILGAGTFFVPCGFTQALQFYVLAQGSAVTGALTMFAFVLGTVPMLLFIGAVSSFTKGAVHRHIIRAAAVLVILLGLLSMPAGVTLIQMVLG